MRLFILENASVGNKVRAIVCAPDASSTLSSDRAMNFLAPSGNRVVLRQSGESELSVTADQFTDHRGRLRDAVVQEAENSVVFEVVYLAGDNEIPAFSFLDQQQAVVTKKTQVQILVSGEMQLSSVWSFQANLAALREYEMKLRTESVVASLVQSQDEMESNRYTDELSEVASSIDFEPNLFLPFQGQINEAVFSCVVHLQERDGSEAFMAQVYSGENDPDVSEYFELRNGQVETLGIKTLL